MPTPSFPLESPQTTSARHQLYEEALGWKISDPWNMKYWLVETKDGDTQHQRRLMPRQNATQPFMNYIQVDSIEDALAKVEAAGGTSPSRNRNRTGHRLDRRLQRHRRKPARLPPVPKKPA